MKTYVWRWSLLAVRAELHSEICGNCQTIVCMPRLHGLTEKALVLQIRQLRLQALQGSAWAEALARGYENELYDRSMRPVADVANTVADRSVDVTTEAIGKLLGNLRELLEMDIALVSEFSDGRRIFRHVDADPSQMSKLEVGQSAPLEDTYCQRVIDGRLPSAIPDTAALPETWGLAATQRLGIAAYLSAPVVLTDGEVYGTLCCISHQVRSALGCRQVDALRSVAALVAAEIEKSRRGLLRH